MAVQKKNRSLAFKFLFSLIFSIGAFSVLLSGFFQSTFLAVLGLAILFWVVILIYIKPIKHVPITLFNASVDGNLTNIERILNEYNLFEKGIYLPPKNLGDVKLSLVFIPNNSQTPLTFTDALSEKKNIKIQNGLLLTPPGLSLLRQFEHNLNRSFADVDFPLSQILIPKLLINNLEIADNIQICLKEKVITVQLKNSLLFHLCADSDNQPYAHTQVGCLLSSALACAFAKITGKPIKIKSETRSTKKNSITIEYSIEEDQ